MFPARGRSAGDDFPSDRGDVVLRAWRDLGRLTLITSACLGCAFAAADEPDSPVPAPLPEQAADDAHAHAVPFHAAPIVGGPAPAPVVYPPPQVIGEYRVGHIHKPWLAHIFQYSTYNPYIDLIHQPYRQTIYGNRHARYYTTYRYLTAPQWNVMYLPQTVPCPPGGTASPAQVDPYARAPYGPGSATYFGAYR